MFQFIVEIDLSKYIFILYYLFTHSKCDVLYIRGEIVCFNCKTINNARRIVQKLSIKSMYITKCVNFYSEKLPLHIVKL